MYSSNLRLKYLFATYRLIEVHHMNMCDICLFYSQRKNTLKCILYYIKYFIQTLLNECRTKIIHIMIWCEIKTLINKDVYLLPLPLFKIWHFFPPREFELKRAVLLFWRHLAPWQLSLLCGRVRAHAHTHTAIEKDYNCTEAAYHQNTTRLKT